MVKRYEFRPQLFRTCCCEVREYEIGIYALYSDYAALEQERDAWKGRSLALAEKHTQLNDEYADALERIAKLEAIVKYHSSHSPGCDVVQTPDRIVDCSCGYNAKLAALSNGLTRETQK